MSQRAPGPLRLAALAGLLSTAGCGLDWGVPYESVSVTPAGDVNEDGCQDLLLIGHWDPALPEGEGAVRLYSGKDGRILQEVPVRIGFLTPSIPLTGKDVNGDGVPDWAWRGRMPGDASREERFRVYSGRDGSLLHSILLERFLLSVPAGWGGDRDGDGCEDLLVLRDATMSIGQGETEAKAIVRLDGNAEYFSGRTGELLETRPITLRDEPAQRAFFADLHGGRPPEPEVHEQAERVVATSAGDFPVRIGLDAAGNPVQARWARPEDAWLQIPFTTPVVADLDGNGRSEVVLSAPGHVGFVPQDPVSGAVFVLEGPGLEPRELLRGPYGEGRFGEPLAAPGDLDGDGFPDLVVGTRRPPEGGLGFAQAFSGADGRLLHTFGQPWDWEPPDWRDWLPPEHLADPDLLAWRVRQPRPDRALALLLYLRNGRLEVEACCWSKQRLYSAKQSPRLDRLKVQGAAVLGVTPPFPETPHERRARLDREAGQRISGGYRSHFRLQSLELASPLPPALYLETTWMDDRFQDLFRLDGSPPARP